MAKSIYKKEDVDEIRPYRLQYNFKEACYMLCIKDTKQLKKWCVTYKIPFHKMTETGNHNYILHDDLVDLIDKVKWRDELMESVYGKSQ